MRTPVSSHNERAGEDRRATPVSEGKREPR